MEEIIKSLTDLEQQIEEAKRNVAVQEGRRSETLNQLKNEFSLNSIEDAISEETKENVDIEKLEKEIRQGFSSLKEKYNW